ncbi:LysR family transcriptional regulator [Xanthobacter sp. TB0139]|uniref:LysR family transcriptional regulator n=1 Tax=Xanthobacter sp. TB0139 TaxID=3459178 RepID=UPI0040399211
MITLRQLRFLVAVADELNFSRAAEKCHVTQPTLSSALKELEDRLGVQLVERTRRKVMMTEIGDRITARSRLLLTAAREIEDLAAAHLRPDEGDLRLGAIPTIGPFLLPPALPLIRRQFPALRLFLREELTESLLEGVHEGRLDVALIALPFPIGTLESMELFEDGYQLAAPPDTSRPQLLESSKLLLLEKGHCLQRHALSAFPDKFLEQDESFAATSLTTLIAMVSEGLGLTLLPNLAVAAGVVGVQHITLAPLPGACPRCVVLVWRSTSSRADIFRRIGALLQNTHENLLATAQEQALKDPRPEGPAPA